MIRFIFWQQYNPISFINRHSQTYNRIWWSAWKSNGLAVLVVAAMLTGIARLSGTNGRFIAGYAILSLTTIQVISALPIMVTQQAQFWFLYVCSPASLLIAFLIGLSPLSSIWALLGWAICLPLLLGNMVENSCTVEIFRQATNLRRDQQRVREGGILPELPTAHLYIRMRLFRLGITGLLVVTLLLSGLGTPLAGSTVIAVFMVVIGSLSLEATLLQWLFKRPIIQFNQNTGQWRTTYIGRKAMYLPQQRLQAIIKPEGSGANASVGILTLLSQGYLGPIIRRAITTLSTDEVHQLALYLSLQPGGASAIRYLISPQDTPQKTILSLYAALATEAGKPANLQQWISSLNIDWPPEGVLNRPQQIQIREMIQSIRKVLLAYTYVPKQFSEAIQSLETFIQTLDYPNQQTYDQLAWPHILLAVLKRHQHRLCDSDQDS